MAEQLTLNQRVEGSSPSGLTTDFPHDMTPKGCGAEAVLSVCSAARPSIASVMWS